MERAFETFLYHLTGATCGAGTATLPEHLSSPSVFIGVCVVQSLVSCIVFCRLLFVLLSLFFWLVCCLSFFDLRILITPFVSSHSSYSRTEYDIAYVLTLIQHMCL